MAQPSKYIPYIDDHPTYKHYYQEPLFRDGYESLDRPDRLVKEAELSKFLHEEGIKGIKYKKVRSVISQRRIVIEENLLTKQENKTTLYLILKQ